MSKTWSQNLTTDQIHQQLREVEKKTKVKGFIGKDARKYKNRLLGELVRRRNECK